MSRVVLPFVLIAGFAGLAAWASWDRLAPPLTVSVVPVQVQTGQRNVSGQELFRANGWIEPFPRPLDVPVQTESMYRVIEVLVNPGDRVKSAQELIRIDRSQAELAVDAAKKKHAKRLAATKTADADVLKADVAISNAEAAASLAKLEGDADVTAMKAEEIRAEAHLRSVELTVTLEEELWKTKAVTSDIKLRQAKQMAAVRALSASRRVVSISQPATDSRFASESAFWPSSTKAAWATSSAADEIRSCA